MCQIVHQWNVVDIYSEFQQMYSNGPSTLASASLDLFKLQVVGSAQ